MNDRSTRYQALVNARKACHQCNGLANASTLRAGEFDSTAIGPWTRWLGDLNARILVVGQDWGDRHAFEKQAGVDVSSNATNKMLRELLCSIGIRVPDVCVTDAPFGVFLTNAILCFKDHGSQSAVRSEWFDVCGPRFLRPHIDIINPRVVVCMGQRAYGAVLSAYDLPAPKNWRATVEGPGVTLPGGSIAMAVYHCGERILNTHRNYEMQVKDWQRIAAVLNGAP